MFLIAENGQPLLTEDNQYILLEEYEYKLLTITVLEDYIQPSTLLQTLTTTQTQYYQPTQQLQTIESTPLIEIIELEETDSGFSTAFSNGFI